MDGAGMTQIAAVVLLAGLFISLTLCSFFLFRFMGQYELVKRAWEASVHRLHYQNRKRKLLERETYSLYGEMEGKSMISKIDGVLSYSGITGRYPWLTSEIFIVVMLLLGLGGIVCICLLWHSMLLALGSVALFWTVVYETANFIRMIRRKRINDELLHFEDLMEIYAVTSDDILQIIGKAAVKLKGPLQTELFFAVYDAQNSGQISLALRRLCNRVENKYFKDLILNLEICSRYLTNYKDVLEAGKKILKQDEQNRKKMQKLYRKSMMFITMFLGIGGVSIHAMGIFAEVEGSLLAYLWAAGTIPRGIVLYLGIVMLYGIWKIAAKLFL